MNVISGNSKVVRNINRAVILNLIRNKQPISRTKLAKLTGLNKSTVSSIVADLLHEEIIDEQLVSESNIGRNPYDLSLRTGKYLVGAINIDSTYTRFAIVDIDGTEIGASVCLTETSLAEKFIETCLDHLDELRIKCNIENLCGLGISISGIVDSKRLTVKFAPNLGWENLKIGDIVSKKWPHIKIISVGNDAKTSALAEQWFGSLGVQLNNFVFLTVGQGIGTGIVIDNKIISGETHASGEFGHMVIFEGGELCTCGNHGCWETYASDRATVKRYLQRKERSPEQRSEIQIEEIISLANNNDRTAIEVLTQTGYYLGLGITNIIRSIDPHAIIIGGKIIKAWDIIYPEIMNIVKKRTSFDYKENMTLILPSSLKVPARLLGAATLAIKELFDDYKIVA